MTYLFFAVNMITLALLAGLYVSTRRELVAERDRAYAREDTLLNRIQAPQQAAVQSMTEQAGPIVPAYVSAFDDEALAEFEQGRERLEAETRALVERYDTAEAAA